MQTVNLLGVLLDAGLFTEGEGLPAARTANPFASSPNHVELLHSNTQPPMFGSMHPLLVGCEVSGAGGGGNIVKGHGPSGAAAGGSSAAASLLLHVVAPLFPSLTCLRGFYFKLPTATAAVPAAYVPHAHWHDAHNAAEGGACHMMPCDDPYAGHDGASDRQGLPLEPCTHAVSDPHAWQHERQQWLLWGSWPRHIPAAPTAAACWQPATCAQPSGAGMPLRCVHVWRRHAAARFWSK